MSYYVIKGPDSNAQYLCVIAGHDCPQWYDRKGARRFPDPESAWNWLGEVKHVHGQRAGSYLGRVVRVMTTADRRAERARLLAEIERMRVEIWDLKEAARTKK